MASNRKRRKSNLRAKRAIPLRLELLESRCLLNATLASYGQLPLAFEPNVGQTSAQADFLAHGRGYTLLLAPNQAILGLQRLPTANSSGQGSRGAPAAPLATDVLTMRLVGGDPTASVTGLDKLRGVSNYLIGNDPSKWHTNVPNYGQIEYQNVYPGIDQIYYGNQGQLEYDLVVNPGASPGAIRLNFQGAQSMTLDAQGNLVLKTSGGNVVEQPPAVYQNIDGVRRSVAGRYVLQDGGSVGFAVGGYDATLPLVIDPVLIDSTYLGGSNYDDATAIAVDSSGNVYVAGTTQSTDFLTARGLQATSGGGSDAFVTELDTGAGIGLGAFSTYLGGSGDDSANAIAVDSFGYIHVAGDTNSTDFPTHNALQTALKGSDNAFVAELLPMGTNFLYSTYLGGSVADHANAIAVDSSRNTFITGSTNSSDFPTANALQTALKGADNAFVTKLNPYGSALLYSTYLGGSDIAIANAIAVDSSGNAYIGGQTTSTDFPTAGPLQTTNHGGGGDAFVAKLNAAGSALVYATYLGGSGSDGASAIAVDSSGNAYVAGGTGSTDFPTASPLQAMNHGGGGDAFVAKLNATGSRLVYSTYLGGTNVDDANAIAVDSSGNAYVAGQTGSTDFPTASPFLATNHGYYDAFVAKLNAAGSGLVYSTYLGGNNFDDANAIAVDSSGNAWVAGITYSTDFPSFGQKIGPGGQGDGFVSEVSYPPAISSLTPSSADEGTTSITLTINGDGFVPTSDVTWNGGSLQTLFVSSTELQATLSSSSGFEEGSATVIVENFVSAGSLPSNPEAFNILDAPLTDTTTTTTVNAIEGASTGSQVVASFADANPSALVSDFANSVIDWGDHTTSTGTVQLVGRTNTAATFKVTGSHNYSDEGNYAVNVGIHDIGGSSVSTNKTTFAVADAALTDTTLAATLNAVDGASTGNQVVATFTDGNPNGAVGDFGNPVINWGDQTTSTGNVQLVGRTGTTASFRVVGSHTYTGLGPFSTQVTVNDVGGLSVSTAATKFSVVLSSWRATDVAMGSDGQARVLWGQTGGSATTWAVNSALQVSAGPVYSVSGGWGAQAAAAGSDGLTRVLWTNSNGSTALWVEDASGTLQALQVFGAISGWTAQDVTVGGDGQTRILWTSNNGQVALWRLNSSLSVVGATVYGPLSGWTAQKVKTAPDGRLWLLWTNTNGTAALWQLNADGSLITGTSCSVNGWQAQDLSVDSSNRAHVLWTNAGVVAVWTVSEAFAVTAATIYGPIAGWSSQRLAAGANGQVWLLWDNDNGAAAVWLVGASGTVLGAGVFGPF